MELEAGKRIPIQLERLLKQTLPSEHILKYKAFFMRLLSMKVNYPKIDENELIAKISRKIDPSRISRFTEMYSKLQKSKSLKTRKELIYLLFKIRECSQPSIFPLQISKPPPKPPKTQASPSQFNPRASIGKLEKELINDLLFILQGCDGKYLKYSHLEDKFIIETSYNFLPLVRMLEEISELAILHLKVIKFIKSNQVSLANSALAQCIQNELSEYYRLIALLKQDQEINLKKIYLWTVEPIEKMKWLSIISEAAETLKGNEVISSLYSYCTLGTGSIKSMIFKALDLVSISLVDMIALWIQEGEINDPYSEFFIIKDDLVDEQNFWNLKFALQAELVPNFFSKDLVEKIFFTGKSINFLKTCCKKEWKVEYKNARPPVYQIEQFSGWVGEIASKTNQELLSVLFNDYKLRVHFAYLRKYLLLGQGDFHHSLMEGLIDILKDNAKRIHKHTLRLVLENSIKNSNFQYEDQEFLNLLDIKLLDPNPLDIGWNVFILDYVVTSPLSTIFPPASVEAYRRIFKFLWHVKRAQFLLNEFQNIRFLIHLSLDPEFFKIIKNLMIFRNSLRHFANNLMSYLMVEAVETGWKDLSLSINKAKDLDQVINIHNFYLKSLLEKTLINEKEIYRQIMGLLDICIKSQDLQVGVMRLGLEKTHNMFEKNGDDMGKYMNDIKELASVFNFEAKNLRKVLASSPNPLLKCLAFRLDFNEFYEVQDF